MGITKEESEKESRVKDLVEKLKRGEINSKDARKELGKRGLLEPERWEIIPWMVYIVLWLIPMLSRQSNLEFLEFFAQLPSFSFPAIVIYLSLAIGVLGIILGAWATRMHYKSGGLNHDETVILLKEGPYGVMRHPAGFGFTLLPILLPIILSPYVAFTILSFAAVITMIVYLYYSCYLEEKLDVKKWGDKYKQYMNEVPGFNFFLGIWRRSRQREKMH